ncbi:MAG: hypothetical protein SFU27_06320 [Thermonemataceae bacterium]|nr:hypothetical protein [Thermonemataceae bacterium]
MIPIRNKIVYKSLEQELNDFKTEDEEYELSEPTFFSNPNLSFSLQQFTTDTNLEEEQQDSQVLWEKIWQTYYLTMELSLEYKILKISDNMAKLLKIENLENPHQTIYLREFLPKEKLPEWQKRWEKLEKGDIQQDIIELLPQANEEDKLILAATLYPVFEQGILQKIMLIAQNITQGISAYKSNTKIELDIDKNLKSAKIIVQL